MEKHTNHPALGDGLETDPPRQFCLAPRNTKKKSRKGGRRAPSKKRAPSRKRSSRPANRPFHEVGKQLGSHFGPLGSALGGVAGSLVGTIFGSGSYTQSLGPDTQIGSGVVDGNVLVAPVSSSMIPAMHRDAEGRVRVSKREFLFDVQIKSVGLLQTFIIQPKTFPWLKQIAGAWSEYIMLGCVVEYVPTSGIAVSGLNAALGTVSAAFVPDNAPITQPVPTSKIDILTYENSISASPAAPWALPVECALEQTQIPVKFVASTFPPVGTSITQQTQLGNVVLLAGGCQSIDTFTCGELWVTYDLLLMQPRKASFPLLLVDQSRAIVAEYMRYLKEYEELTEIGSPAFTGTALETIAYYSKLAQLTASFAEPSMVRARMFIDEQEACYRAEEQQLAAEKKRAVEQRLLESLRAADGVLV